MELESALALVAEKLNSQKAVLELKRYFYLYIYVGYTLFERAVSRGTLREAAARLFPELAVSLLKLTRRV